MGDAKAVSELFSGEHQQWRKMIVGLPHWAPSLHLNWEVNTLLKTSKADALLIEAKVIAEFASKHGIPIGNVAEIAKWGKLYLEAGLSSNAVKILSKFLKF